MWKQISFLCLGCAIMAAPARAGILGPLNYTGVADSPFLGLTPLTPGDSATLLYVEDFETAADYVTGTGANGVPVGTVRVTNRFDILGKGVITGTGVDSVENGDAGFSFNDDDGSVQVNFFKVNGLFPTYVGLVATDWTSATSASVSLYGFTSVDDVSVGIPIAVDSATGGDSATGQNIFLGVSSAGGIQTLVILNNNTSGPRGIEVDHVQFGFLSASVPEPSSWLIMGCAVGTVLWRRGRRA
jgi:hypothetical protein